MSIETKKKGQKNFQLSKDFHFILQKFLTTKFSLLNTIEIKSFIGIIFQNFRQYKF